MSNSSEAGRNVKQQNRYEQFGTLIDAILAGTQNIIGAVMSVKIFPTLIAGLGYFALGGLWFTPLFGKQWDNAVGFSRPPKWRPSVTYYFGPLFGCWVATTSTALLIYWTQGVTLEHHLSVGVTAGVGIAAVTTSVNAISPNMPRPGLYALVVGSYHAVGLSLAAMLLYWLS